MDMAKCYEKYFRKGSHCMWLRVLQSLVSPWKVKKENKSEKRKSLEQRVFLFGHQANY